MDQAVENQFVKFDEDLLKCIFLDHKWGANLTKNLNRNDINMLLFA